MVLVGMVVTIMGEKVGKWWGGRAVVVRESNRRLIGE